jgi:DNA/RNA endonuclease G (NUC1)
MVAGRVTFEVPLRITVELGVQGAGAGTAVEAAPAREVLTEAMREPVHDDDYGSRAGYDPRFLSGVTVPLPSARDSSVLAPLKAGGTELRYENFSIRMHAARRLALITASNVTRDARLRKPEPGRDYTRKGLSGLGKNDMERWFTDSRLDDRFQVPDFFYSRDDGAFDKGHLVRREDVAWGRTYATLQRANGDTYHVTNCSPQIAQFNQSARGEDNWGDLENLVLSEASEERLCVFAGPILDAADETFVGRAGGGQALRLKIPSRFWKVIVSRIQPGIASYGFVLEQDLADVPLEFAVSANFRRLQVPLSQIEAATGVDFGDAIRDADTFDSQAGEEAAWRGGLTRVELLVAGDEVSRPTPNGGDDAAAETGSAAPRVAAATEASVQWRVARSLQVLRRQVDAHAPQRSRASDGTIGDAAHATRDSDHNPWVRDGAFGVVTALDITHDPAHGVDSQALAETIVANRDKRVKYVISNRRIANFASIGGAEPWAWRPYGGANPHDKHVHISVRPEKDAYDDEGPWQI